jgi:hypothetical protein
MGNNGHINERQKLFCEKIVVNPNATRAAIAAEYSMRSASSIGHENLQKPKIQRYINQLRQERNLRTQVTADRVLAELAKITFAEKGVKTGYKLKALNMLAKHVGLYDKKSREYLETIKEKEILKEKESEPKKHKALNEDEEWFQRIMEFLPGTETMAIHQAFQKMEDPLDAEESNGLNKAAFETGDNGEETKTNGKFNGLRLMDKVLGEERIKTEVMAKLDSLFGWS